MKNIIIMSLLMFITLISCKQKANENIENKVSVFEECKVIKDTLNVSYNESIVADYSIKKLNELENFKKEILTVNYDADSLQRYSFFINQKRIDITIDSCVYKKNKFISTFFINKKVVSKKIIFVKDSVHFGYDNLAVDYKMSTIFYNKVDNLLLLENFAGRSVGSATNWKFYQLIDLDRYSMYEYYSYYNSK